MHPRPYKRRFLQDHIAVTVDPLAGIAGKLSEEVLDLKQIISRAGVNPDHPLHTHVHNDVGRMLMSAA